MGNCFGKCCAPRIPNIKLNVISSCCKTSRNNLVLHNEDDFEKLKEIIKELNHHQTIKISKSKLYIEDI